MNKSHNYYTLAIIPTALALNISIGVIVNMLKIPVYLDAIGTVLTVLLLYPFGKKALWSGIAVGIGSFLIAGVILNPVLFWFTGTQAVIAIYTYYVFAKILFLHEQANNTKKLVISILSGVFLGFVAAIVNAPIVALIFGGVTGSGPSLIAALFLKAGQNVWEATMSFGLTSEPIDKALQCMIAFIVYNRLISGGLKLGDTEKK